MSSFLEQVSSDLDSVFMNTGEFAELHVIDGSYEVACVLDETEVVHTAEGVTLLQTVLRVPATSLAAPVVGQRMTIDARPADVVSVDEEQGLRVIRLQWYVS